MGRSTIGQVYAAYIIILTPLYGHQAIKADGQQLDLAYSTLEVLELRMQGSAHAGTGQ